jgi:hypothetical protein
LSGECGFTHTLHHFLSRASLGPNMAGATGGGGGGMRCVLRSRVEVGFAEGPQTPVCIGSPTIMPQHAQNIKTSYESVIRNSHR